MEVDSDLNEARDEGNCKSRNPPHASSDDLNYARLYTNYAAITIIKAVLSIPVDNVSMISILHTTHRR